MGDLATIYKQRIEDRVDIQPKTMGTLASTFAARSSASAKQVSRSGGHARNSASRSLPITIYVMRLRLPRSRREWMFRPSRRGSIMLMAALCSCGYVPTIAERRARFRQRRSHFNQAFETTERALRSLRIQCGEAEAWR